MEGEFDETSKGIEPRMEVTKVEKTRLIDFEEELGLFGTEEEEEDEDELVWSKEEYDKSLRWRRGGLAVSGAFDGEEITEGVVVLTETGEVKLLETDNSNWVAVGESGVEKEVGEDVQSSKMVLSWSSSEEWSASVDWMEFVNEMPSSSAELEGCAMVLELSKRQKKELKKKKKKKN